MTAINTRRLPAWLMVGGFVLAASAASAQSLSSGGIAGVVRDATGAVLPGVTVEASSPALIEKVRDAVTDEQGQYKIVELRPGTYSVTFTLAGFNTLKRDGVEVTTGFTATVNGELRIGALEETVTVTGSSPVVDSHNVRTQALLSNETLSAIPTNKTFQAFAALTVGVTVSSGGGQDVGGDRGETFATISIHGGDPADQRLLMDGMRYAIPQIRGQAKYYNANQLAVSEVTLETAGASAESESGGIQVNMVPKEGGNSFKGTFTANYTNHSLQSDNLDEQLKARGVTSPPLVKEIYDFGGAFGGPIRRNVLWFFGSVRNWGTERNAAGNYFNATPHTLFYTPDLSRPAYTDIYNRDGSLRLTWQAAPKHKVTFSTSYQSNCICYFQIENNRAPEATDHEDYGPVALTQATWTYPATNRLLFQAGVTHGVNEELHGRTEGVTRTDIAVQDLATGYFYGARAGVSVVDYQTTKNPQLNGRLAASYVTGSHALKIGFSFMQGQVEAGLDLNTPPVLYQFRNRAPVSITYYASPSYYISKMFTYGVYAQDQWTIGRLTLNPGVRFDHIHAWNPAQSRPAGMFVDAISFPEVDDVPNWKDVVPRLGAAWDPRGDGKTAIKGFIGKFVGQESLGLAAATNGSNSVVQQANRTWTDSNGDYVPQEIELGPLSNAAFGTVAVNTRYAPELLTGTRPYNWQASASIQREVRSGIGVTVGYFRTWYGNFTVTDNQLVTPADYDPYCITAPVDSRLPGGGGTPQCGLYDIKPAAFGPVDNLVTAAANFGSQQQVFDGVDATVNARFRRGQLSGGVSTGRTITDNCYSVDSPQQQRPGYCHVVLPFAGQTQVKFSGVVPLPWNANISGVFQNLPGVAIMANYTATNAEIAPSLGRNLGACGTRPTCTAVATAAIIEPNTMRENRLTQVDVRFTKTFVFGRMRLQGMFDAYNVFNANTILGRNDAYGPTWGRPTAILGARLFKFGAQFDF
jgi:hypothetical protein